MTKFSQSRLRKLFDDLNALRIAVVGDLMLDSYMWGSVQRISPEAPVPVVEVTSETVKLGGAANVANNIVNLGASALPLGVVGDDFSGGQIRDLFASLGVDVNGVITDPARPTTIKTRIIAHDQHVVRADVESKADLSAEVEDKLLDFFKKSVSRIIGVILQDYNKGVLTPRLIREIIEISREHGIFVAVDPKFNNFFDFVGVDLFKPNTRETEQVLGIKIQSEQDLWDAAKTLFERINCRQIMITRGEKGMTLFSGPDAEPYYVPTRAKKIHDVSGAGDTVISTFVVAMIAQATLKEAATLANFAAGIVCGEVGVVPIERDRLLAELLKDGLE